MNSEDRERIDELVWRMALTGEAGWEDYEELKRLVGDEYDAYEDLICELTEEADRLSGVARSRLCEEVLGMNLRRVYGTGAKGAHAPLKHYGRYVIGCSRNDFTGIPQGQMDQLMVADLNTDDDEWGRVNRKIAAKMRELGIKVFSSWQRRPGNE